MTPPWSCWMPSACRCLSADASCARTSDYKASSSSLVMDERLMLIWSGHWVTKLSDFLFSRTLLEPILVIPTSRTNHNSWCLENWWQGQCPTGFSLRSFLWRLPGAWHKFGGWWSLMAVIAIFLKGLFSHLTNLLMVQGISCGYLKTPKYNLMLQCFKIGIIPAFPAISSTWAQWFRRWRNGPSAKSTSLKRRASLCSSFVSRTRARCSDDSIRLQWPGGWRFDAATAGDSCF